VNEVAPRLTYPRWHPQTFDCIGRLSGGYDKSFAQGTTIDPTRAASLPLEPLDQPLGLLAFGRAGDNAYGMFGTFDGMFIPGNSTNNHRSS
jgi:hypothetical protein